MNQTRTIRLPIHVVKELNVYLRAARELNTKLDHEPVPEEICQKCLIALFEDVTKDAWPNEKVVLLMRPLWENTTKVWLEIPGRHASSRSRSGPPTGDCTTRIELWLDELE